MRLHDLHVGVRVDTATTAAALRERLAGFVVDDVEAPPAFRLRAQVVAYRGRGSVPHLAFGPDVIARAHDPADVLDALCGHLGGLAARAVAPQEPWVAVRVFERNGRVVLGLVPYPDLLGDRGLAEAGVAEVPCWTPLAQPGAVLIPPPLVSQTARRLPVAGAVVLGAETTAQGVAALAARASSGGVWFTLLQHLGAGDRIASTMTRSAARRAVVSLLSEP